MKGAILVSAAVSSLVSIIGIIVALNILAPAVVEAQETRIRAERVVVVDDSGTNRVTMSTGPIVSRSAVSVFSEAGISRAYMSTVGSGGVDGDAVNLVLFAPEGRLASGAEGIARLGTGAGGAGATFHLADRQGQIRIWLQVDGDGNPSIEMRDASGNVTWRAQ